MVYYAPQPAPYYPASAPLLSPHPLALATSGPTLRTGNATWAPAPPPPIPQQNSVESMLLNAAPRPCTLSCCSPIEPPQILTTPVYSVSYSLAGALTPVDAPKPLQRAPAARAQLAPSLSRVSPLLACAETHSPPSGTSVYMQDVPSSSVESFYKTKTSGCSARWSLPPSPAHVHDAPFSSLEYFYEPDTSSCSARWSLSPSPVHVQDAPSEDFYEPEMSSCSSLTPSPPPPPRVVSVKAELPHNSLSAFGGSSVRGPTKTKCQPHRDKSRIVISSLTGGQPYVCDICSVPFIRKHDGERHRRSHTGERPFPCHGGCGKAFRRADARSRHWGVYHECESRHTTFLEGTPEGAQRTRRLLKRAKRAELVAQGIARPLIERILKKM